MDDFVDSNPAAHRNLQRLWNIIKAKFDVIADGSVERDEFYEGFIIQSYVEVIVFFDATMPISELIHFASG